MKNLLSCCLVILLLLVNTYQAQAALPDGSTAPNWTLTDINGNTYTLYDILDEGKMVALDFSATWCPPCWSYHNTHILDDLYNNYGPNGTDEVMVFFIEGDLTTNNACLYGPNGCVGGTMGDWVTGTSYPIIDLTSSTVRNQYNITYWPTIYAICPDRTLFEASQISLANWLTWIETCSFDGSAVATDVVCAGEGNGAIDLTPTGGYGGISYSWSNGSTTQDLNNLPAGNYSVTMTEGHGYSIERGPFTVGGPTSPLEVVTNFEQDINCNGDGNGEIDISPTGGTPGYSYLWNTGQVTSNINNLQAGSYTVTLTDNNSCTDVEIYDISEPPLLELSTIVTNENCGNADGEIIAQGAGGSPSYSYDIGLGAESSGYFPNLSEGLYSLTITDANGCMELEDVIIINNPSPVADAGDNSNIDCTTPQINLDGSGSSTGNNIVYSWMTIDGNIVSGANTTTPLIDAPGSYDLMVSNSSTGCFEMSNVIIIGDLTPPVANAGPSANLTCSNNTVTLDGSDSDSGTNISYLWTTSNGNIVSGETTTAPVVDADGTYTLTVSNGDNGCSAQASTTVSINNNNPTAAANAANSLDCATTQVSLDGNGSSAGAGFSYLWTTSNGNILTGDTTLTPVVDAAGTYSLLVTNDSNGCTSSAEATVTQNNSLPTANAGTANDLNCTTNSISLDGSNSESGSHITYLWVTSNGNIVSGASTTTPVVDEAGTYTLVVTNTSTGCSASSSVNVINDSTAPDADAGNASDITCINNTITLDGTGSSSGTNINYQWSTSNGNIVSGATTDSPVVDEAGTYSLLVTNTNNNCTSTASVSISENTTSPSANAGTGGQLTCTTNMLTLDGSGSSSGSNFSYNWTTSNGNIVSGANSTSPEVDEAGTYQLIVTNTDNGCTASANAVVTQNENLPNADAGNEAELNCNASQVTLNGNNSSGGNNISYQWSTSNGNIVSGANSTSPVVDEAGTYTLVVTNNNNGCTASSTISVSENLNAPTADAGNTDELNCNNNSITLDGTDSSSGSNYSYSWSTNNGNIAAGANTATPTVDEAGTYQLVVTNNNNGCTNSDQVNITEAPVLELNLDNQVNVLCHGSNTGAATIEADGGNGSYSYSWPSGGNQATEDDLSAGTYIATVTDGNNCTQTLNITITEPAALSINATSTNETAAAANDGSANVNPSGGTSGYTYLWSNGATTAAINNLSPGLYTVIVTDANNCSSTTTVTVNSFDCFVAASISSSNVSCFSGNNGTATATTNGGNSPYTYQWSNGSSTATISNLSAGIYELTVSDADNCPATAQIIITQPEAVNVSLTTGTPVTCFGDTNGSATVSANGGNNTFTYSWSNGATGATVNNLSAGLYTVTASDGNQCTASMSVTVTQPNLLELSLNNTDETIAGANDGTATANPSGGNTPYSYLWSTGATSATINNLAPGSYSVVITDANGCTETGAIVINGVACNLSYTVNTTAVTCAGNANGATSINGLVGDYEFNWSTGATTSSISDLPAGDYFVSISNENGCEEVEQISITEPPVLEVTANTTEPNCAGMDDGSILLSTVGGNAPYTFIWQDGSTDPDYTNVGAGQYIATVTDFKGCTTTMSVSLSEPDGLSSSTTTTNTSSASANDGSATVIPDGGTGDYNFLWSNGATTATINDLSPGTYQVTVMDENGCTTNNTATIQGVDCFLNSTITSSNISCAQHTDGTATITIGGGSGNYNYLWSNNAITATISNLTAGTYSVTATDDLGCLIVDQVSIIAPAELSTIPISINSPDCNDGTNGSIQTSTDGGTGNYNYLWSNGATTANLNNVAAGTYSLLTTDANGCQSNNTFTLTAPNAITTTIVDQTSVQCANDATGIAIANASGGEGTFTYEWSDGQNTATATGLIAGTYTVIATDQNGCSGTSTITISVSDNIPPVAMAQNTTIVLNENGMASLNPEMVNAGSSDNCSIASLLLDINNFDCTMLGDNVVQFSATDGAGNTSMTSAIVTVIDNMAPTIECEQNVVSGNCSAPVTYELPVVYDNCMAGAPELLIGLGSGAIFPVGNSIEVYKVTDNSGNTATCSFTVMIEDTEAPEIECPDNIALTGCAQEVNYSLPTALDACSTIGIPTLSQGLGNGSVFPEGLSTEMYEVADAAGNTATCSFTINITNNLDGDISDLQNACYAEENGTATVIGNGGVAPYSYDWDNGQTTATATGLAAALYSVIVTDATGCSNEVFVTVSENPAIIVNLDGIQNESGNNNGAISISPEGGTGTLTFAWSSDNGFDSDQEDIDGLSAGTYTCIVTDEEGCTTAAGPYEVEMISGTNDPELASLITIYPNPTDGEVQIQLNQFVQGEVQVEVFSITGQQLPGNIIRKNDNNTYTTNLSGQPNGLYLIKIRVEEKVIVKRIVLNQG